MCAKALTSHLHGILATDRASTGRPVTREGDLRTYPDGARPIFACLPLPAFGTLRIFPSIPHPVKVPGAIHALPKLIFASRMHLENHPDRQSG